MSDALATKAELEALQKAARIPHLPTQLTFEARRAIDGEGPRAYSWSDKPHRLVFDLCREIEGNAALPAVQPDAAAHGAEHWDTLAPWSKYSSDVVLVVHHILTEPVVPTATVRFELPERAGSDVLGHCAADTVEEAVMGAIDAAQTKLRAMIDNPGKEVSDAN